MDLGFKNTGMHKCQSAKFDTSRYDKRFIIDPCFESLDNINELCKYYDESFKPDDYWGHKKIEFVKHCYNKKLIPNVNSIMGNPIYPGSVTFINGESGTGKTTFLLQVCGEYAFKNYRTGFISGEQDVAFVQRMCENLFVADVDIGNITDIDDVIAIMNNYDILVIDSFPCLRYNVEKYGKKTGNKATDFMLDKIVSAAQNSNTALIIVLHSTKTGNYRGPTTLIHTVENLIKMSKTSNGVEVTTTKSRLAPPTSITLKFGKAGFDCIRSFMLLDNDLLIPDMLTIMLNLFKSPASDYTNWIRRTHKFCEDFQTKWSTSSRYSKLNNVIARTLQQYYKLNKLKPNTLY